MQISFYFLFLLIATLVIPFRFNTKILDTNSYIEYIDKINSGLYVDVESSFLYISKLSNFLGSDYYIVFLIYAIIGFFIKIILIGRISSFPLVSIIIYFSHNFILDELIQIRVGAALTFTTLSIWYLAKDRVWLFALYAVISIWFHNALLFIFIAIILFYFLRILINNNIILLLIFFFQLVTMASIIIKLDFIKMFVEPLLIEVSYGKILAYIKDYEPDFFKFSYLKFLFFIFISTPGIYLMLKNKVDSIFIWYCMLLNSTSPIIYGIFFNYTTIGIRLSDIFMFFNIFTVAYYIEKFKYAGHYIAGVIILVYIIKLGFNITSYVPSL